MAIALLGAGVLSVSRARADGGFPRAFEILFEPGNASHIVVRSEYWGLFDHRDGAVGWSLYCAEAFGGRALAQEKFPTVVTQGGRILVASSFSGLKASDDGCTWRTLGAFGNATVQAIAPLDADGKNFVLVSVLGSDGGVTSRAFRSSDRGDTWTMLSGAFPANLSIMSIAVAPSDPMRMYVAGVQVGPGTRLLSVTTDGGVSWKTLPIDAPTGFDSMVVSGVHPTRPDVVFLRIDSQDPPDPIPDELYATPDAGKTWVHTYTAISDLPGLAFSPDGKKVFIGGQGDGIEVAAVDDAIAKPGAFSPVFSGNVWGLKTFAGKLYAGNDDFTPRGVPRRMVGVSTDEGVTFTTVMDHCDAAFPTCAPASTMEASCRQQWERQGGYVTDFLQSDACVMGTGGAGGAAGSSAAGASSSGGTGPVLTGGTAGTPPRPASPGSSCAVGPGTRPPSVPTLFLVAAGAFARRLLRRRR